ncbi:radical SAM/SPASM domain-containing protein [Ruminiclostridium cellobioparum]|jgi:uncharacterized protein|uniref:radical SAM/SPASM domain-containing protein n=1 Tax=Ruminiclostridium cellobioparum TaxID=29355 RepID=UPI0028AAB766|nr:radical SAM protein [Ruminiclostridium cellobioparum]
MKESKYNIIKKTSENTIIYNVNSSGVLRLNNEYSYEFDDLINRNNCNKSDLIAALKSGRMIVDDDSEEINSLILNSLLSRYNTHNLTLTIAPTLECNFACNYCYEEGYRKHTMTSEVQDKVIDFVKHYSKGISKLGVAWYGGEPLLAIGIIEKLTESFLTIAGDKIKYSSSLVTNGYNLNKDTSRKLKELKVEKIQVTIDGPREIHDSRRYLHSKAGTFDKIISNIKESCSEIPIIIRINVDKSNVQFLNDLLICFEENDLKGKVSLYIAPVDNINNSCTNTECLSVSDFSIEEINFYNEAWKKGFNSVTIPPNNASICGAVCVNSFVIDPKGDLYKCWNHIGHVEESVGSVINNEINSNIYKWLLYNPFDNVNCRECIVMPACMGGCPYQVINNDINKCKSIKHNAVEILNLFSNSKNQKSV